MGAEEAACGQQHLPARPFLLPAALLSSLPLICSFLWLRVGKARTENPKVLTAWLLQDRPILKRNNPMIEVSGNGPGRSCIDWLVSAPPGHALITGAEEVMVWHFGHKRRPDCLIKSGYITFSGAHFLVLFYAWEFSYFQKLLYFYLLCVYYKNIYPLKENSQSQPPLKIFLVGDFHEINKQNMKITSTPWRCCFPINLLQH